mgnify:CR=1 FL=1
MALEQEPIIGPSRIRLFFIHQEICLTDMYIRKFYANQLLARCYYHQWKNRCIQVNLTGLTIPILVQVDRLIA